jgi:hypothetical protein
MLRSSRHEHQARSLPPASWLCRPRVTQSDSAYGAVRPRFHGVAKLYSICEQDDTGMVGLGVWLSGVGMLRNKICLSLVKKV